MPRPQCVNGRYGTKLTVKTTHVFEHKQ